MMASRVMNLTNEEILTTAEIYEGTTEKVVNQKILWYRHLE